MSTEILEIGDLYVTSFWGGVDRGTMLQFTIAQEFAQLTTSEVEKLVAELDNWLDQAEERPGFWARLCSTQGYRGE